MKATKFEAKLRDINRMKFPLVKAAFQGKDGNVYLGFMLIDTGANSCVLNKSALQFLPNSVVRKGETKTIQSLSSATNVCQAVDFTFKMGNGEFSDVFYVNDEMDFDCKIKYLIGIIGLEFLCKHKLVLDYSTETLHQSDSNLDASLDYGYFFPMGYGIKRYDLPVVGLVNNDNEYVLIVDSGANITTLAKCLSEAIVLPDDNSNITIGTVTGFDNKIVNTSIRTVDLCMVSLGDSEDETKLCKYTDEAQILEDRNYLIDGSKDSDGTEILPVSGLLSSSFMLEHKWVLDFGVGVIYSKAS